MQTVRPTPITSPLIGFGAASIAAFVALLVSLAINLNFGVTVSFALASIVLSEAARRALGSPPWWLAYLGLGPWLAIVLLPWLYFTVDGRWPAVGAIVDLQLPRTWVFNLLALVGLTIGSIIGMTGRRRPEAPTQQPIAPNVHWRAVSIVNTALLAVYLAGFVLSGRSLSTLWKLSGAPTYGFAQSTNAVLGLDGLPIAASALLLVAAAARRRRQVRPPVVELAWLGVLSLQALGSGVRQFLFLLVFGWLLVQILPTLSTNGRRSHRIAAATIAIVAIAAVVPVANRIAELRSGGNYGPSGSAIDYTVHNVDVISSAEMLFATGVRPGTLGGKSYAELPVLLIPRRILGANKPNPASDELVRQRLSPVIGYSAPLWIEAALNFDWPGVLIFSLLFSGLFVWILTRARSSNRRIGRAVALFGPVWIIVSYIMLVRLTLFGGLFATGSVVLGVILAAHCVTWNAQPVESR